MALTGKSIQVLFHEIPFTSYLDSVGVSRERPPLETTTLGATDRTYVKGQRNGSMSFSGFYENTSIDALDNDYANDENPIISVNYGTAAGSRANMIYGSESTVAINGSVTELVRFDAEVNAVENAVEQGILLLPLTTATSTANGDIFDRGATATAPGGSISQLHVSTISGTLATLVVTVETDTDAAMLTPATVATFSTVTVAGGATAERKESAVTMERYVRATYTIGGSTPSVTLAVTFASRQY